MKVTVYTSADCGPCFATKHLLKAQGIEFEEVNVEDQPGLKDKFWNMGHRALPVVMLENGENWSGFQMDKIRAIKGKIKA